MFIELHDQLASLDRHAQLTRRFSAVAELLDSLITTSIVVSRYILYSAPRDAIGYSAKRGIQIACRGRLSVCL